LASIDGSGVGDDQVPTFEDFAELSRNLGTGEDSSLSLVCALRKMSMIDEVVAHWY